MLLQVSPSSQSRWRRRPRERCPYGATQAQQVSSAESAADPDEPLLGQCLTGADVVKVKDYPRCVAVQAV
jgi:hypothetical protein